MCMHITQGSPQKSTSVLPNNSLHNFSYEGTDPAAAYHLEHQDQLLSMAKQNWLHVYGESCRSMCATLLTSMRASLGTINASTISFWICPSKKNQQLECMECNDDIIIHDHTCLSCQWTYCAVVPYWSFMSPREMAVGMAGKPTTPCEHAIQQWHHCRCALEVITNPIQSEERGQMPPIVSPPNQIKWWAELHRTAMQMQLWKSSVGYQPLRYSWPVDTLHK